MVESMTGTGQCEYVTTTLGEQPQRHAAATTMMELPLLTPR